MKRFFSWLLAGFCAIFCAGWQCDEVCAEEEKVWTLEQAQTEPNAFRIVRSVGENIALSYVFPVNSAAFLGLGYSEKDVKLFRFYLSIYVASLATQNRERAGEGVEVGQVTSFADVDGIGFSIVFDDLTAQQNFFGGEGNSSTSSVKTSGFFMAKTEIFVDFPISEASASAMKLVCSYAVLSWAQNEGISDTSALLSTLDNSIFVYQFDTTDQILRSDLMQSGETISHFFVRDSATLGEQICFYAKTPNVPVWYALALLAVVLAMFVSYAILRRKQRKCEIFG